MNALELTERIQATTPFVKLLGINVIKADGDGFAEMSMPIKEEFTQNLGFAHGGAVGTLADFAANLAVKEPTITVEYKINFFAPAMGQELFAAAKIIRQGLKLAVVQSDIYALNNGIRKHVATCLATIIPSPKNRLQKFKLIGTPSHAAE